MMSPSMSRSAEALSVVGMTSPEALRGWRRMLRVTPCATTSRRAATNSRASSRLMNREIDCSSTSSRRRPSRRETASLASRILPSRSQTNTGSGALAMMMSAASAGLPVPIPTLHGISAISCPPAGPVFVDPESRIVEESVKSIKDLHKSSLVDAQSEPSNAVEFDCRGCWRPNRSTSGGALTPARFVAAGRSDVAGVVMAAATFPKQHLAGVISAFRVCGVHRMPSPTVRAVQFVTGVQRRMFARVIDGAHKAACILSPWADSSGPLCGPRLKLGGAGGPGVPKRASPNATEPPEGNMQPGVQVPRLAT